MSKKTETKAEDWPEWLPVGWMMKVKTRRTGVKDRYYTCPLSGTTFRSKPEVMRYLNNQKVDGRASKAAPTDGDNKQLSKPEYMHNLNKKMVVGHASKAEPSDGDNKQLLVERARADNPSEWLPAGWILEIRTLKSSALSGQNYTCYFDPFSGSRFYSKGEVLRYLKDHKVTSLTADERSMINTKPPGFCSSSSQKKSINTNLTDNVHVQIDYSPSGFPRGWIKEIRSRKANSKRKDSYYIDPVNRYTFRSRTEAFCYMETGKIPYRLKGKHTLAGYTLNKEPILQIAAKKMKVKRVAVRRGLFQRKTPMSDVKTVTENANQLQHSPSPLLGNALEHPDKNDSCLTPANIEKLDQGKEKSQSGNQPNAAFQMEETSCQPAARTPSKLEGDKPPVPSKPLEAENLLITDACPLVRKKIELKKQRTWHKKRKQTWHKKRKREFPVGSSNTKPTKSVSNQPSPRKSKVKAITTPIRTSKRLAGIKVDVDLGIVDHSRRVKAKRSNERQATPVGESDPSCGLDQKVVPIIDAELEDKLGSKPITDAKLEDKLGSNEPLAEQADKEQPVDPLATIPFGDSWPDPCIEFAFKTLTGEIPVLDDTVAIQDYFDKQFVSTQSSSLTGGLSSEARSGPSPSCNDRRCSLENGKMNQQCHQKTGLNH